MQQRLGRGASRIVAAGELTPPFRFWLRVSRKKIALRLPVRPCALLPDRRNEQLTLNEHTAIVNKVEAHNAHGAVKAMADHLNRANALYKLENR
jgi:DNA-binding GntR family transcriptional regulator